MQWQINHPDHQDAIVSEKLKLLKTTSFKAEQKQAGVGALKHRHLTLWFCSRRLSPDVEDFDLRFQRC